MKAVAQAEPDEATTETQDSLVGLLRQQVQSMEQLLKEQQLANQPLQQLADQQQSQLQEQQWEITEMQRQLVALRVVKAAHGRSTQRRRQQHWQPPRPRDKADAIVAAQQRMGQQQQQMVQQ